MSDSGVPVGDEWVELEELVGKTTPGVWKVWGMSVQADQDGTSNVDTAVEVAFTCFRDANGKPRTFDADFIARAQRAVPALIAELRRALAENERRWAALGCDACRRQSCAGHLAPEGMTVNGHRINALEAELADARRALDAVAAVRDRWADEGGPRYPYSMALTTALAASRPGLSPSPESEAGPAACDACDGSCGVCPYIAPTEEQR